MCRKEERWQRNMARAAFSCSAADWKDGEVVHTGAALFVLKVIRRDSQWTVGAFVLVLFTRNGSEERGWRLAFLKRILRESYCRPSYINYWTESQPRDAIQRCSVAEKMADEN
jgi:hypothetical protein